jgi:hypothetical protein
MYDLRRDPTVRTYRVYTVGRYGQFLAVKKFEAPTDERALTMARLIVIDGDLEVWTGDRKVGVA